MLPDQQKLHQNARDEVTHLGLCKFLLHTAIFSHF